MGVMSWPVCFFPPTPWSLNSLGSSWLGRVRRRCSKTFSAISRRPDRVVRPASVKAEASDPSLFEALKTCSQAGSHWMGLKQWQSSSGSWKV